MIKQRATCHKLLKLLFFLFLSYGCLVASQLPNNKAIITSHQDKHRVQRSLSEIDRKNREADIDRNKRKRQENVKLKMINKFNITTKPGPLTSMEDGKAQFHTSRATSFDETRQAVSLSMMEKNTIEVPGEQIDHENVEFLLPPLNEGQQVKGAAVQIKIKRKRRQAEISPQNFQSERVRVKVYAPTLVPLTKSPMYHIGTFRNMERKDAGPASEHGIGRGRKSKRNLGDSHKLIAQLDLARDKSKWQILPLSSWFVQEMIESNATRIKLQIICNRCEGLGVGKSKKTTEAQDVKKTTRKRDKSQSLEMSKIEDNLRRGKRHPRKLKKHNPQQHQQVQNRRRRGRKEQRHTKEDKKKNSKPSTVKDQNNLPHLIIFLRPSSYSKK